MSIIVTRGAALGLIVLTASLAPRPAGAGDPAIDAALGAFPAAVPPTQLTAGPHSGEAGPQPEPPSGPEFTAGSRDPAPMSLLLPAVNAAREAARRASPGALPPPVVATPLPSVGPVTLQKKHLSTIKHEPLR